MKHNRIVAQSDPATLKTRKIVALRLSRLASELGRAAYKAHDVRSDIAQDAQRGYLSSYDPRTTMELANGDVELKFKALRESTEFAYELGAISNEVMVAIDLLAYRLKRFADRDFAERRTGATVKTPAYPIESMAAWKFLRKLDDVARSTVYAMLGSQYEIDQADAHREQSYREFSAQQSRVIERDRVLDRMPDAELAALADELRSQGADMPKPRWSRSTNRFGTTTPNAWMTGDSERKIKNAILKFEFQNQLAKPAGYDNWLNELWRKNS